MARGRAMSNTARSQILARIRHASRRANAADIEQELSALGTAPAAPMPSADLCTAFLANVLANQGTAACAQNRSQAVKAVAAYVYEHYRSQRLVAGHDPRLAAMPWRDAGVLPRFGAAEDGDVVALSFARLGIAETGAIVTFTGRANPAANNLMPERHIVLIDSADLVMDMEAAWRRIGAEVEAAGRPRGINFIAGPSSTADIEAQLVHGAHGPTGWHVILTGAVPDTALSEARSLIGQ